MSKNFRHKLEVFFIILFWVWSCNGGFSQSFFSTVSGACATETRLELGMKFTTSTKATITGLRFYKCRTDAATYEIKLYANGNFISSIPYTGTASGWVTVPYSYDLQPGVNYMVSYLTPGGNYQAVQTYAWPVTNGPLTATGSAYRYGGGFPNLTFQTSNYFVDVVLQGAPPKKDTIYIRDTVKVRDTITLPCYPPDSTIITNINGGTQYHYYYHDTVTNLVTIHDTMYLTKPTEYIRDTIIIKDSLPAYYAVYQYDTIPVYDTVKVTDTTFVLITFDGYDSTNYKTYFDRYFEVEYFNLPNGQKFRFRAQIEKHWYKEQWDDLLQLWIPVKQ